MRPGALNITAGDGKFYLGGHGIYVPLDPEQALHEVENFRYILVAVYAWLAWEHIVTFSVEWQRWKQLLFRRKFVLVDVCVLVSRYLSWTNAIASAVFFFGNPFSCQSTFTWIFVTYALIWAFTATIFIVRVQSLYPGQRNLHRFVWICFALVAILWCISLGFFYSARLPPQYRAPRMPECVAAPSPYVDVLGFGGSMCFDVLILALTVNSASRNFASRRSRHGGVMSAQVWVLETAIIYAAVCFACNTALFFVWIFQKNVILRAYPIPFAIVVNPIVAGRIVFHGATWGSKTALLESRLVKITEEDVANWQRDPGVLGAAPAAPHSRRPSQAHVMLPVKVPIGGAVGSGGGGGIVPSDSKSASVSGDSAYEKSAFGGGVDERLGFQGLFATRRVSVGGNPTAASARKESDAGLAVDEKNSSSSSADGSLTFGLAAPPRAATRGPQPTARADAMTPRSVHSSVLGDLDDLDDDDDDDDDETVDVGPMGERKRSGRMHNSPHVDVVSAGPAWRRGSADDVDSPRTHRVTAPRGWTIEEMLRDDGGGGGGGGGGEGELEADLERGLARQPQQFSDRFDLHHARSARSLTARAPPVLPPVVDDDNNNHVTISQHVTTRID